MGGAGSRRATRATLALVGVSAVVAGFVSGDVGKGLPAAGHRPSRPPSRPSTQQPAVAVDTAWASRGKKVLAQIDADLAQIDKAERAAAAVPRARWSPRLRALMRRLEQRKAGLLRLRPILRTDVSLVEAYGQAAHGLAGTRRQLELLNQARGSLGALSGPARDQLTWILRGLEDQAGRLSKEERTHRDTEESLRSPAQQASGKPLPELPDDVDSLARDVADEAAATPPPAPRPGQTRPGADGPRSDRPSASPQAPPAKPTQTTAPPHPHGSSASKAPDGKGAAAGKTPPAETAPPAVAPARPRVPAPPQATEPPAAAPATFSDSGGGGDSGSAVSDSAASDASSDVGSDTGSDAGSDTGSDAGSDGGSDGGDGGF